MNRRPAGSAHDSRDYERSFDDLVASLVTDAAGRAPAFAERLAAAGLDPAEVTDVAALERLPVLAKDDLLELQQAAPPFGGLLSATASPRRVFQSPGPLYEPELRGGDSWRWAPALAAAGFGPSDVVLVAFGFHLSPAGAMFEAACLELGATVLPAGVGSKDLQVRACADLGVTAFVGPPSYLKALFDAADPAGVPLDIRRAFVTAEPLPPSLRSWLDERVATLRQGYGTAETGHLGHECAERVGLHVPVDALVQICDLTTGASLHDGSEGEVVVTLFDPDYPVVRFGTGDLSAWMDEPCSCGASTPRTRGWTGRAGDAVKVRGMFLHPRQIQHALRDLPDVADYRLVIDRVDHRDVLRCEVVAAGEPTGLAETVAGIIRDRLRFGAEVHLVDRLEEGHPVLVDVRSWE